MQTSGKKTMEGADGSDEREHTATLLDENKGIGCASIACCTGGAGGG